MTTHWLFLTHFMEMGGNERALVQVMARLRAVHPEARITLGLLQKSGPMLAEVPSGVEVVEFGGTGGFLRKNLSRGRKLVAFLRGRRPDAVVSFLTHINMFALFCSLFAPAARYFPVEQCALTGDFRTGGRLRIPLWRRLGAALLYRRARRVVAISTGLRDELARLFWLPAGRLAVIHNPVDVARVAAFRRDPVDDPFTFVYLGRYVPQKNPLLLVRAFAELCRAEPSARFSLKLIGYGDLEPDMRRLSAELGVADRLDWKGLLPEPWGEVAAGHALVLSSNFEGFANVIVEALALGRPVVATDCPYGPGEILTGGPDLGLLSPPGDAAALAAALRRLWKDYARWSHGGAARAAHAERFSKDRTGDAYAALLLA